MTALTLTLVAGMAMGSDGQECISAETAQGFGVNNQWKGTWRGWSELFPDTVEVTLKPGAMRWKSPDIVFDTELRCK